VYGWIPTCLLDIDQIAIEWQLYFLLQVCCAEGQGKLGSQPVTPGWRGDDEYWL